MSKGHTYAVKECLGDRLMNQVKLHCSLNNTSATEVVNSNELTSMLNARNYLQGQNSSPTILGVNLNYRSTDMYTMISQHHYQKLVSRMNELTKSNEELEETLALKIYTEELMSRPDVKALLDGDADIESISETYEEFIKRVPEARVDD